MPGTLTITNFTATPAAAYEGEGISLSWSIDDSEVIGNLSIEIRDTSMNLLHTSSSNSGSHNTIVSDLGGIAQDVSYTILAWDTNSPGEVQQQTTLVSADPGIPQANTQTLTTPANTALPITLTGNDPNNLPSPLSYTIVTSPINGTLTGSPPNLTYQPNASFQGPDSFTFEVGDGKYSSSVTTISLTVQVPPLAPSGINLSTTSINETVTTNSFVAFLEAEDANPDDTHIFSLVSGPGDTNNSSFTIIDNQLRSQINFTGLADSTFNIRIRAEDNSVCNTKRALL